MKGRKSHKRADGGKVEEAGGNPSVFADLKRKRGGRVKGREKEEGKEAGRPPGELSRHRLDRPGRKRGGRVGADTNPLSSAHNTTSPSAEAD